MAVLWSRPEATVREVADALAAEHGLAYTTVLTVLRILVRKGYAVSRAPSPSTTSRAHVFSARTSPSDARAEAVQDLVRRFFGGSPDALARHLVEAQGLDPRELDALEARLLKGAGE
jgi:predicted transcriptional regulator